MSTRGLRILILVKYGTMVLKVFGEVVAYSPFEVGGQFGNARLTFVRIVEDGGAPLVVFVGG
jgi:hypothetical protein